MRFYRLIDWIKLKLTDTDYNYILSMIFIFALFGGRACCVHFAIIRHKENVAILTMFYL